MPGRIRIGVDVGGTFTHAVAIEAGALSLLGKAKVLTTHSAQEGVALGVTQALGLLLRETGIAPSDVGFIAHSTTQATNALLEGDVAPVGIVAIGSGLEGTRTRSQTKLGDIPLGASRALVTTQEYIDSHRIQEDAPTAIASLKSHGARALVIAEAFSVDDPAAEKAVNEIASQAEIPATGTHEISGLYGLRTRTRTAALNASILPPMMEAAAMTEQSVHDSGIGAPLMVMRSDGGVMSLAQVRRRPLLTILSGPAAGVAAALMFVRLSHGIFLEVGGTSTDISLIMLGKSQLKSAEIGGHRLFLRTLDVRTMGLGGGSMIRINGKVLADVGPRSAHIAGLQYCCFTDTEKLRGAEVALVAPRKGDAPDHVILRSPDGTQYALTLTCAANAAGMLAPGDHASGNVESAQLAFAALATFCGRVGQEKTLAQDVLAMAAKKAAEVVGKLAGEYGMERESIALVGGGGGAGVIVPGVGAEMKAPYSICPESEVISAVGVAMALVRESVERNIANPTPEDLLRIRQEAEEGAIRSGASPDSIQVEVEVEPQQNLVRAIASGATELRVRDEMQRDLSTEELLKMAADSLSVATEQVQVLGSAGATSAYGAELTKRGLFGLTKTVTHPVRLIDREGIIRLQLSNGLVLICNASEATGVLRKVIDAHTSYGDAGPVLPKIFFVARERITNLSGHLTAEHVISLAGAELGRAAPEDQVLVIVGL